MPWSPTESETKPATITQNKTVWKYRIEGYEFHWGVGKDGLVVTVRYSWGWKAAGDEYKTSGQSEKTYEDVASYFDEKPVQTTLRRELDCVLLDILADKGEIPAGTWSAT